MNDFTFKGHDKSNKVTSEKNILTAQEFTTNTNINQFNKYGDSIEIVIKNIDINDIDEYQFNPRTSVNRRFNDIKESIAQIGLSQLFSVAKNPKTNRYILTKGGNTRLRAIIELYKETSDNKYTTIACVVEPWDENKINKTQIVIQHLIENEARGELILVDKAKAICDLELDFMSIHSTDIKSSKHNPKTQLFLEFLSNNGYNISEGLLSLFRFTVTKLVGNLDHHLNKGLGSPQIVKIRSIHSNYLRLIKKHSPTNFDVVGYEEKFSQALQQYKSKKIFDFEDLVNIIASHIINNKLLNNFNTQTLVKELLATKKDINKSKTNIDVSKNNNTQNNNIATINTDSPIDDTQTIREEDTENNNHNNTNNNINNTEHSALNEPDSITEQLQTLRKQAFDISQKIAETNNIVNCITKTYVGCGFIMTNIPKPQDSASWHMWWQLLTNSCVFSITEPISNLPYHKIIDILNQGYSFETTISDMLVKVRKTSELARPYHYTIMNDKHTTPVREWQQITQLEFICYQINKICIDNNIQLWSNTNE